MSDMPYFGGIDLGKVKPIPAKTFAAFAQYVNDHVKSLSITRARFLAMSKADRAKVKCTEYFTPSAFLEAGPRRTSRATVCNLVAIDIDNPEDARMLAGSGKAMKQRLSGLAFLAYETASSTPDAPRIRVVVAANAIPLREYPKAVRHVASLLGLSEVTPESLTAVQPMFLPTIFSGEDVL